MNKAKENSHNKEKVNAWSNKHQSFHLHWVRRVRRVRRDIGEDHSCCLLHEPFDVWRCLMNWQETGPPNCCVHNISISYHGKFHIESLRPSCGLGIRASNSTRNTDRGLWALLGVLQWAPHEKMLKRRPRGAGLSLTNIRHHSSIWQATTPAEQAEAILPFLLSFLPSSFLPCFPPLTFFFFFLFLLSLFLNISAEEIRSVVSPAE